jgi:RNA polymerase sigma factor (sigma-70 family)
MVERVLGGVCGDPRHRNAAVIKARRMTIPICDMRGNRICTAAGRATRSPQTRAATHTEKPHMATLWGAPQTVWQHAGMPDACPAVPASGDSGHAARVGAHAPSWLEPSLHKRLLHSARRLTHGNHADAEDLVQDTYLKLLSRPGVDIESEPAWLLTVLRHLAIDRIRRTQFEAEWFEALPWSTSADQPEAFVAAVEETPESQLERWQRCEQALRRLLRCLGGAESALLLLRDVFDWDHTELAAALGRSHAATRQLMHRLRRRQQNFADGDPACEGALPPQRQALLRTCLLAIMQRDARELEALVRSPAPSATRRLARSGVRVRAAAAAPPAATASQCRIEQVDGSYVLGVTLNGVVLCTMPIGPLGSMELLDSYSDHESALAGMAPV